MVDEHEEKRPHADAEAKHVGRQIAQANLPEDILAPRRVGVAEFEQLWLTKQFTVLDVRTADEFKAGHLPGAVNLDVLDSGFEKQVAALDKAKTYLVHCAAGSRSANAAGQMKQLGFKSVVDLAPGFNGWKTAGKPVEK